MPLGVNTSYGKSKKKAKKMKKGYMPGHMARYDVYNNVEILAGEAKKTKKSRHRI